MYRFFVMPDGIDEKNGRISINGDDVNHIRNVLRLKDGEQVLICTGSPEDQNEYLCELDYSLKSAASDTAFGERSVSGNGGRNKGRANAREIGLRILEKRLCMSELPSRIYLFQGLPKADKLENIIMRAVELGAYEIVPVLMKRTVVRLNDSKSARKGERWNAIALSAAMQSKRGIIPKVTEPVSWEKAMKLAEGCDHILVPYENAEGAAYTRKVISKIEKGQSIAVFIGPEGGFEEGEIEDLKQQGAKILSLGRRILRTETAGPAVLSAIMLALED